MATVKEKDYLLSESTKTDGSTVMKLFRAMSVEGSTIHARLEDKPHTNERIFQLQSTAVTFNLGPVPPIGKVYGYDLASLYRGKFDSAVGEIHVFGDPPTKEYRASFKKAADSCMNWLTKRGIADIATPIVYEMRSTKSKYAGTYSGSADLDKKAPVITFYQQDSEEVEYQATYVLMHELGHALEYQALVNYPKLISQWVKIHSKTLAPAFISTSDLDDMRSHLMTSKVATFNDWTAKFDSEEDKPKIVALLRWIRQHRSLKTVDLKALVEIDKEKVAEMIPDTAIETKSSIKPVISEYATKNYHETIAEAFAWFHAGKKLPPVISELTDRSISLARDFLKK